MIRDAVDYNELAVPIFDEKEKNTFKDIPLKLELSLVDINYLKRKVWKNARKQGWLNE